MLKQVQHDIMIDIRQSEKYGKYLESLGWIVERHTENGLRFQIFIKKIPLLGSVIKFQRVNFPIPVDWIEDICKKYHALFVKIEPDISVILSPSISLGINSTKNPDRSTVAQRDPSQARDDMIKNGYELDNWPLLPPKTIVLGISKTEEDLLLGMEKDTRYCVRKSIENGLAVEMFNNVILGSEKRATPESNNQNDKGKLDPGQARMTNSEAIEEFIKLWSENAKRKGFWVPFEKEIKAMWNAFGDDAFLVFAKRDEKICAGGLFIRNGETLHYMHAGATVEGRDLLAPYRVIWEAIKLGKQLGCARLDFEGIYDERYKKLTKKWHGFTHFKKGFDGEEISYIGSFIKFRNPLFKLLFKIGS